MSKEVVGDASTQAEELMARITDPRDESHVAPGFSTTGRAEMTDAVKDEM